MPDSNSTSTQEPTPNTAAPVTAAPAPVLHYRQAFAQVLPIAQSLDAEDLITINIDVPSAVTTALGALPEILALRDRIAKELPTFDLKYLDELATYAKATGHAHALYTAASAPPEAIQALNEKGLVLRDLMYSDAVALSNRALINGERLGDFKSAVGFKNLAFDLLGLAAIFRGSWPSIVSRTAVTEAELDQAESIGEQLVDAVGAREQGPAVVAEVAQRRQRVFTVFLKAYDQARRAVSYLRWREEDADTIAPSLYAGRVSRKKRDAQSATPATPSSPSVPSAPNTPAPGAAPAGTSPFGATGAAGSAINPAPVAVGLPGSNPFVS